MVNFSKKGIFKQIAATILFIVFMPIAFNSSVFASCKTAAQIGAAGVKLPVALIANYYDCKDETKKALIWDSCYRSLCILDTALKVVNTNSGKHNEILKFINLNIDDSISLLELGWAAYDLYNLFYNFYNIKKLSFDGSVDNKLKKKLLGRDAGFEPFLEKNNRGKRRLTVKKILTLIKSGAFITDSLSSMKFGLDDEAIYSQIGACSRTLAFCLDNKNEDINSPYIAVLAVYGIITSIKSFFSASDVDVENFNVVQDKALAEETVDVLQGEEDLLLPARRSQRDRRPPLRFRDFLSSSANLNLPSQTEDAQLQDIPSQIGLRQLRDHLRQEKLDQCSICLEDIGKDADHRSIVIAGGCHHIFCRQGLEKWAKLNPRFWQRPTCPNCRKPITGVAFITIEGD